MNPMTIERQISDIPSGHFYGIRSSEVKVYAWEWWGH